VKRVSAKGGVAGESRRRAAVAGVVLDRRAECAAIRA